MSAVGPVRVRALSFQAGYRCARSGACCSSGWEIAVEPELVERLPLLTGVERAPGLRKGSGDAPRSFLRPRPDGRCPLLRGDGLCAVHAQLGEPALPSACRQFPRVVTLTPLGASVTLSHYCPTAARLLLASGRSSAEPAAAGATPPADRIVEAPRSFPASWLYEGLDAREALPPLLRPGVLMTWPALEHWEEHAVAVLTRPGGSPEAALDRLASLAERARRWRPSAGTFDPFFLAVLAEDRSRAGDPGEATVAAGPFAALREASDARAWDLVASTAFEPSRVPPPPSAEAGAGGAARDWGALAPAVGRWLASRAFGSWLALQGGGLRSTVAGLRVALAVLRAEAARRCESRRRPLDAEALVEAVRGADLLLVHLADPERLASEISRCEAA